VHLVRSRWRGTIATIQQHDVPRDRDFYTTKNLCFGIAWGELVCLATFHTPVSPQFHLRCPPAYKNSLREVKRSAIRLTGHFLQTGPVGIDSHPRLDRWALIHTPRRYNAEVWDCASRCRGMVASRAGCPIRCFCGGSAAAVGCNH
jgi:hypothetical protein